MASLRSAENGLCIRGAAGGGIKLCESGRSGGVYLSLQTSLPRMGDRRLTDGSSELSQLWDSLQAQRAEGFESAVEAILGGLTDVGRTRAVWRNAPEFGGFCGSCHACGGTGILETQAGSLRTTIADLDTQLAALDAVRHSWTPEGSSNSGCKKNS